MLSRYIALDVISFFFVCDYFPKYFRGSVCIIWNTIAWEYINICLIISSGCYFAGPLISVQVVKLIVLTLQLTDVPQCMLQWFQKLSQISQKDGKMWTGDFFIPLLLVSRLVLLQQHKITKGGLLFYCSWNLALEYLFSQTVFKFKKLRQATLAEMIKSSKIAVSICYPKRSKATDRVSTLTCQDARNSKL